MRELLKKAGRLRKVEAVVKTKDRFRYVCPYSHESPASRKTKSLSALRRVALSSFFRSQSSSLALSQKTRVTHGLDTCFLLAISRLVLVLPIRQSLRQLPSRWHASRRDQQPQLLLNQPVPLIYLPSSY